MSMIQLHGTTDRTTSISLTKGIQAVENWTILSDVKALECTQLLMLRFRRYGTQKSHVIISMKTTKVTVSSRVRSQNLHSLMHAVMNKQGMRHPDAVGFHGVTLAVVIIPHLVVVEVGHSSFGPIVARRQRVPGSVHHRSSSPPPHSDSLCVRAWVCASLSLWGLLRLFCSKARKTQTTKTGNGKQQQGTKWVKGKKQNTKENNQNSNRNFAPQKKPLKNPNPELGSSLVLLWPSFFFKFIIYYLVFLFQIYLFIYLFIYCGGEISQLGGRIF